MQENVKFIDDFKARSIEMCDIDRRFHTALISQRESHYQKNSQKLIDHFRYIKILTWLRGLGE